MDRCWCGNESLKEYSEKYWKCDKCHTLVSKYDFNEDLYDIEDEEHDLYGKNYWEKEMTQKVSRNTLSEVIDVYLSERVIYWLKYILKYVKLGGYIAEVGCGLGQLQYVLKCAGYKQIAFELSHEICEYMKKTLKINVHCGTFENIGDKYDAVMGFDLFEHLVYPEDFLEKAAKGMKDNGIICLQTPCYDDALDYDSMMQEKPRFEEQLKENQHIFLYSRESITAILQKWGFNYIKFEQAFFGNDYDMFLFASKAPFQENSKDEIDEYLNDSDNGRLIKTIITLFDQRADLERQYLVADKDRKERLKNLNILEEQLRESEADRADRFRQIQTLTNIINEMNSRKEDEG